MDGNWMTDMKAFDPGADSRAFRDALGSFATGVTVVTTGSADGPVGITASSFASVSLDPPLVLWSPAKSSGRFRYFRSARHYSIHVLDGCQQRICDGFARDRHAFDGIGWTADENGVPQIEDCLARFDCTLDAAHDAGDHVIIVGRVTRAAFRSGSPLVVQAGRFVSRLAED